MWLRTAVALTIYLCLMHAGVDSGVAQGLSDDSDLRAEIDEIVAPYLKARDFMGVIGVGSQKSRPLLVAYGLASVELAVEHSEADIFMIGSVSKQFTAVAVLLLEEDGLLNTDDPVAKYVPEFEDLPPLTLHQLLTHTSGVSDIYSLPRFGRTAGQAATFDEVIEDLAGTGLAFAPGSRYAYSNGGYSVLAAVIESVSGMPYADFLHQRIFAPLGLSSTAHDSPQAATLRRVPGYDPWGLADVVPAVPVSSAFTAGSGSLWSSAADLLTWTLALHRGEVVGPNSYQKLVTDYGNGYGYGLSVFRRFGRRAIGHDGRVSGYASDLAYYPDDSTAVAVLSNVQSVARDEIRRLVAAAVFGEAYTVPATRAFADEAEPLSELTGRYSFGPSFVVTITESGGRLMARANQGGSSQLVPTRESTWFSRMLYATVRFERDANGVVDRLVWGVTDNAPVGRRMY